MADKPPLAYDVPHCGLCQKPLTACENTDCYRNKMQEDYELIQRQRKLLRGLVDRREAAGRLKKTLEEELEEASNRRSRKCKPER